MEKILHDSKAMYKIYCMCPALIPTHDCRGCRVNKKFFDVTLPAWVLYIKELSL